MTVDTRDLDRHPLRVPRFRAYLILRFLSLVGDAAWYFSLAWEVGRIGGAVAVGTVFSVGGIPILVLTLIGGISADRYGIWRTVIVFDLLAAGVAAVVAIRWTYHHELSILIVAAFVFGAVDSFYGPAANAIGRLLLTDGQLGRASAARQTVAAVAGIVGTSIGGLLVSTGFEWVAGVDAVTFAAIGLGLVFLRPGTEPLSEKSRPAERPRALDAFRIVGQSRFLRLSLVQAVLLNLVGTAILNVGLVLRAQELGWSSIRLSAIDICLSAGMIAAGVVTLRLPKARRPGRMMVDSFALYSVVLLGLMISHWLVFSCVLALVAGAALIPGLSLSNALLQTNSPRESLGGVNGIMIAASMGSTTLGCALFGYSASITSVLTTSVAAALILIVVSGLFAFTPVIVDAQLGRTSE